MKHGMDALRQIEKQLAHLFRLVPGLGEQKKRILFQVWPYIAIFGSIIQLFFAWDIYSGTRQAAFPSSDYVNQLYIATSGHTKNLTGSSRLLAYSGCLLLITAAACMFLAYPALQKQRKKGWDLMLTAFIIGTIYAVLSLFLYNGGVFMFASFLAYSITGIYLLYQVRGKYKGGLRIVTTRKK